MYLSVCFEGGRGSGVAFQNSATGPDLKIRRCPNFNLVHISTSCCEGMLGNLCRFLECSNGHNKSLNDEILSGRERYGLTSNK